MPRETSSECYTGLEAVYATYQTTITAIALLTLRTLALEIREEIGEAAAIMQMDASDQGDYLLLEAILDADGNVLSEDPTGDGIDFEYLASNLDEANESTWSVYVIDEDRPAWMPERTRRDTRRWFLIGPILQATEVVAT